MFIISTLNWHQLDEDFYRSIYMPLIMIVSEYVGFYLRTAERL